MFDPMKTRVSMKDTGSLQWLESHAPRRERGTWRARAGIAMMLASSILFGAGCAQHKMPPHEPTPPTTPTRAVPPQPPVAPNPPTPAQAPTPPVAPISATPPTPPTTPAAMVPPATGLREIFPGLRIDLVNKLIELDAQVPIDAHNPRTPRVYLELFVCPPDSKEHEAVALTKVPPSQVHAALLLLGLEPGSPGRFSFEGKRLVSIPPTGPRLRVTLAYERDGKTIELPASDWAVTTRDGQSLTKHAPTEGFVFAGSMIVKRQDREVYYADTDGTLIGLTTFGGECIAWSGMHNPDSGIEEPHWIADAKVVPPFGTPVVVRIRPE